MAVAFDAVSQHEEATVQTGSYSHTVGAGSDLAVVVGIAFGPRGTTDAGASIAVTCGGVSMTPLGLVHSNDQVYGFVALFGLAGVTAGVNTIAWATSGTTGDFTLNIGTMSFSGVDGTTPFGTAQTAYSSGTAISVAVSSATDHMVVDASCTGSGFSSSSQTLEWSQNGDTSSAAGNGAGSIADGASSVTMGYTVTSDWNGIVAVDILPAGSGGSALTQSLSDTISSADALNNALGINKSDGMSLADSLALAVALGLADTVTLGDAIAMGVGVTTTDTVTLADALSYVTGLGLSLSDTINLADAITREWAAARGLTDATTISDSLTRVWAASLELGDTVTLADDIIKAVGAHRGDSVAMADALSKAFGVDVADSVTLTDAHALDIATFLADTLTLSESFTPLGATPTDWTQSLSDTITVADALHRTLSDAGATSAQAAHARTVFLNRFGIIT